MDLDAYSSFVALDVEASKPLFTAGLIAGTQYADTEDAPPRRPRHGLEVLKRGVQFWDTSSLVAPVSFIAHLGDVLAPEAAGALAGALASYGEVVARCKRPQFHVACGSSDLLALGPKGVGAVAPLRPAPPAASYYAFAPVAGWRVLVLDASAVSLLGHEPGSAAHSQAVSLLAQAVPAVSVAATAGTDLLSLPDPLAGVEGAARRFHPRGGGLGEAQLGWLREQLSLAEAASERALVLCHRSCLRDSCVPEAPSARWHAVHASALKASLHLLRPRRRCSLIAMRRSRRSARMRA